MSKLSFTILSFVCAVTAVAQQQPKRERYTCMPTTFDVRGAPVIPEGFGEYVKETVDEVTGNVHELYPDDDTSTDEWYQGRVLAADGCEANIGDVLPDVIVDDKYDGIDLPQASEAFELAEPRVTEKIQTKKIMLPPVVEKTFIYDEPKFCGPHKVPCSGNPSYAFRGADIIYVRGLHDESLRRMLAGTNLPRWPQNPGAFYGNAYWKTIANAYWSEHIEKFVKPRGNNRYLTIAWADTQRLDFAANAMLKQIADAMISGKGVVAAASDPRAKDGFCVPHCMVVSHSAGSVISNVTLSMAGNAQFYPKLGKFDFIAKHVRAHIALNGAISGSPWATMALGAAGASATSPLCIAANLYLERPAGASCAKYGTLYGTILSDLHPPYMQARWRPLVHLATVPTITVAGGSHETLFPFKVHFVPGLDDGVVSMDSSCGRDVIRSHWPSGSMPIGIIGLGRAFDLGMALTDQQPLRAAIEYREQLGPHRDGMLRLAAACTPFKTPWGMWQLVVPSPQAFNYFTHHYPFLQTAENHGYTKIFLDERDDMIGRARPELEDTRAIINPMLYQLDLVDPAVKTAQVEFHKGMRLRFPLTRRSMWLWRRTYHRMQDWQTKSAADYVYDYVR